ncbi:AEC family transporter [Paludicola sp. MB14-C6]|uniref:AEC family transporter n=1 Tax=Paludihabitans sp. MB14-C6 TaxID=3070656 RepID=UPI0027DC2EF9|nr:AEC family transporter [Paludicola sp. MB14-C6]WMJ21887.1 AEC family transporter [Paludicola sp. MB14-C6]
MDNLLLSFHIILPLFIMLALGYIIKATKLVDDHTLEQMNDVCFKVLFPILMFNNIYKTELKYAFKPKLLLFAIGSVICIFLLLCFLVPLIEKSNSKRGVLIQGIFRSNFVIFGLPIAISLCGEKHIGPTSILIAIIVPLYNALSVVILEVYRGEGVHIKRILKGIITNPLIIGGVIGVIAMLLHLQLPVPIDKTINDLSKITTPLALMLLGASFRFSDIRSYRKQITIGVLGKLIIIPLIFIPISVLLGFRGYELVPLVVMLGAPPAVSTYTIAGKMDADQTLAGQLVVFGSIGCIVTMFLWIFIGKQLFLF